jgi:coenzyme F420-0:L-glutamate ligase / coenzyme F420-1:gamma-L-glutamate ligase
LNAQSLAIIALPGMPLIQPGDDIVSLICAALRRAGLTLQTGDVLVVTSKIISKSEGRYVDLQTVTPGPEAVQLAQETEKDPRVVELILRESQAVSRKAPGVLITRHRLGFTSANAGIDHSNVVGSDETVLLLPVDPDASASAICQGIFETTGVEVGIVVSDSHGRPFRLGTVAVAVGLAGMPALLDLRGQPDLFGRELRASIMGYGDMVASAANLVAGEGKDGFPVVLVRGLDFPPQDGHARDLIRPFERDLYL